METNAKSRNITDLQIMSLNHHRFSPHSYSLLCTKNDIQGLVPMKVLEASPTFVTPVMLASQRHLSLKRKK